MLASRFLSRVSRGVGRRSLLLVSASREHQLPGLSNQRRSIVFESPNKVSLFHHSALNSTLFHRVGFSSASPEPKEKEQGNGAENNGAGSTKLNEDSKASDEANDAGSGGTEVTDQTTTESGFDLESESHSVKRRRRGTKQTAFSDSDSEGEIELSREDLIKLLVEKEEVVKTKQKEMENMQDKVLRSYAEMENIKDRTRREAENSKKFAIQNFAKGLLDVADNLGRASSVVKESFSKIDTSNDATGAVPLLKSLLEGVEMTEKQLGEVFKKFGLEKFDPTNEPFDPHRHNAVFQVPDDTKPPGTVAHVLKSGYMLYDRVIRPAEVGVIQ